jgi:hypothetical protein
MPFLEYHRLIKSNYKTVRTSRGYEELDSWQRLEEIVQVGNRLGVHEPRLAKAIMSAGGCPELWRIYYAATKDVQTDSIFSGTEYLGNNVPAGTTRRRLGKLFEQWVTHANQAYNDFLETGRLESLDHIPGTIGAYYRERARQHSRESSREDFRLSRMTLGRLSSGLPIYDLDPDGVFCEGPPGAVFESKLTLQGASHLEFESEMAIYALVVEKSCQKDIDFAITLCSDFPRGLQVLSLVRRIFDSHVAEITLNLEKFYRLIQFSEGAHRQGRVSQLGPRFRSLTHLGYRSWKSFLVRPDGLPEQSNRQYCEACRYRSDCFKDGGEA